MEEIKKTSSGKELLIRTLSGAVYVAIIVGFFILRKFVDERLFQVLVFALTALSTYEVARAVKPYTHKINIFVSTAVGILVIPVFCLFEYFIMSGYGYLFALNTVLLGIIVWVIISIFTDMELKELRWGIIPIVYPSFLMIALAICSNFSYKYGFMATLLIFVISPCTDVFAYLVGMTYSKIRKGKAKKLCPKLSPKKTWAGAIGGLIGAVAGALIIYLIAKNVSGLYIYVKLKPAWVFYVLVGLGGGIFTQAGDLIESLLKRKTGIKDMGKIMPGHGGAMDRIDGMSLNSVFVMIMFFLVM